MRFSRRGFVGSILALILPSVAHALKLDKQAMNIRYARSRYGLIDEVEALMRAQLRLENGRKGSEAGLNPIRPTSFRDKGDPQAYADLGPDGAEQHVRLARRMLRDLSRYVMRNAWSRKQFMKHYSARYLGRGKGPGGKSGKAGHDAYYAELSKLYAAELPKVKKYNPVVDDDS